MVLANNATIILTDEALQQILLDNNIFQLNNPRFVVVKNAEELEKLRKSLANKRISMLKL